MIKTPYFRDTRFYVGAFDRASSARVKPFYARAIQVAYEWRPAERWRKDYTRIAAVVLYPLGVKRQLVTIDNAKARALELARQKILRPWPCRRS